MTEVKFKSWTCRVQRSKYGNGRTALQLVDDEGPIATATVNLPDKPLGPNEVFIKDYSENTRMLAALEKAGIVERTGEWVKSGFVDVPKARLTGRGI
jgi:hypothetical protein